MKDIVKDKPLFFVFTCIKDGNQYIGKLFERMLHQTKYNFVHYIYEDGSNEPLGSLIDNYKEEVRKLGNPYEVIYEYNPINIGLNKATQYCISKCVGKYFLWIDCDNYIDYSFFDEMERLYKRHKKSLVLRSISYDANNENKIYFCNCGTLKDAKTKYQFGLLLRRKYYYSTFAVNFKRYLLINPQNIFLYDRNFYNDEQVLMLCLLCDGRTFLSRKAISYFLKRDNQESSQYNSSINEYRTFQSRLCFLVNQKLCHKLDAYYDIWDLYNVLSEVYKTNYSKSKTIIKKIRILSRKNDISLGNFYRPNLTRYLLKSYYWRIKRKWKN